MSVPRTDPGFTMAELADAGTRFVEAGLDYWEASHKAGIPGAVVWIEADQGLVIFTRGEYRQTLLKNIPEVGPIRQFGSARDD